MSKTKWAAFVLAGGTLIAAVLWMGFGESQADLPRDRIPVSALLPTAAEVPGWTRADLSLGDTPEIQREVRDTLLFDEAAFVTYRRGEVRISVYCAYWRPGLVSYRMVANHTPDVCWRLQGWRCQEQRTTTLSLPGMDARVPDAEVRTFTREGRTEHVYFWHLVGGKVYYAGNEEKLPGYKFLRDLPKMGLRQKDEQYFLRISSEQPWEEFAGSEVVSLIMSRLQRAGLPVASQSNR